MKTTPESFFTRLLRPIFSWIFTSKTQKDAQSCTTRLLDIKKNSPGMRKRSVNRRIRRSKMVTVSDRFSDEIVTLQLAAAIEPSIIKKSCTERMKKAVLESISTTICSDEDEENRDSEDYEKVGDTLLKKVSIEEFAENQELLLARIIENLSKITKISDTQSLKLRYEKSLQDSFEHLELTFEDYRMVELIWKTDSQYGYYILIQNSSIFEKISIKNLQTLMPQTWLNDEVLNGYFRLINHRLNQLGINKQIMNTFFFGIIERFLEGNKSRIITILRKQKVDWVTLEEIYIPINRGSTHWSFCYFSLRTNTITYCDSMYSGDSRPFPTSLKLCIECIASSIYAIRAENETGSEGLVFKTANNFPQQNNCYDCGMFTIKGIEELSLSNCTDFSQKDMYLYRILTCISLVRGRIV